MTIVEGGEEKKVTNESELLGQRAPTKRKSAPPEKRTRAIRGHSRLRINPLNDKLMKRSFDVWTDHVYGMNTYDLMKKYNVSQYTIECDIKCQSELQQEIQRKKREEKVAVMMKMYIDVIKNQMRKGDLYDDVLLGGGKVTDSTGSVIVSAVTRLEKLLGLDSTVKVDLNVRAVLDAIDGEDGRDEPST